MGEKSLKILKLIFIYVISSAVIQFICFPLQRMFGIWGLIATELIILAIAVLSCVFSKFSMKECFRFKVVKLPLVIFSVILLIGFYLLTIAISSLASVVFPQLTNFASSNSQSMKSVSLPLGILTFALLPAFCEEMLFRGTIQYCMSEINPTLRVILCGILFGAFHMDLPRFFITATLGIALALVREKTDSMILNISFHFAINLLSFISNITSDTSSTAAPSVLSLLLAALQYAIISIPFIVVGIIFINSYTKKDKV